MSDTSERADELEKLWIAIEDHYRTVLSEASMHPHDKR